MVITATLPIGFPAVFVAQGRKHLGMTGTVPPQQLQLGLNLTVRDFLNSVWLRRNCTLSRWGLFLNTVPPSAKPLGTVKKIVCAFPSEICLVY